MVDERVGGERVGDGFDVHRQRRALFGGAVDRYERGRPGYPEAVYELLERGCGLGPGAAVLEVGPGPGQVTGPLLARGARVTAVELSDALADRLRHNHPTPALEIVRGAFESVELPEARFDLAVAAAVFHWVPTEVGLAKLGSALREGGWAALWWSVYADAERHDPLAEPLRRVLARRAPEMLDDPGAGAHPGQPGLHHGLQVADRLADFERTGLFAPARFELFRWTARHDAEGVRALFGTFSPFLALPPATLQATLDDLAAVVDHELGGTVERPYLTPVYLAQRLPRAASGCAGR
ncbi:MAG: class I SAM-dependent methyltransferase [Acidimicrobiia bacterium]